MPIKLKGKDYYTVVERMDMLLDEVGRKNYSLETDVVYESGVVIVKAILTIYSENTARTYTGNALGELGKAKTLEATETHALGRALSAAGWFGSEFASANEIESYNVDKSRSKKSEKTTTESGKDGTVKYIINFGKHNGKEWKDVDEDYVKWVAGNSNVDWQREEANSELQRRSKGPEENNTPEESEEGGMPDDFVPLEKKDEIPF
tara:strand:- start:16031 stop:16648 length:618 start_codon:yes stop_codon:yes gene_type:complete